MNAEPFVYHIHQSSTDEQKFFRLHERSRFYPVEVDAAGKAGTVEPGLMITCLLLSILKKCDLLSEGVEDCQLDI